MVPNVYYIVFSSLYIISGSLLTIIVTHLLINRKTIRPGLSLLVLIFVWIWLTCQLLEYILTDINLKILFTTLQYIGIFLLPPSWVGFCYHYATRKDKQALRLTIILSIIPLAALILTLTNTFHGLIWRDIFLHENRIKVVKEFTLLYYIFLAYSYLFIISGFVILLVMIIKKPHYQRRQSIILIIASFIPLIANISENIFSKYLSSLELTPLVFSFASLIVIYFVRLRYFRTIPLAQHIVIESMSDILILLDPENQIIYVNPAGIEIIQDQDTPIAGKPLALFLPDLAEVVQNIPLDAFGNEEIKINETTYNISVSPMYNWRHSFISRVVALRDITHLTIVEANLKQLTNHLEARVIDRTKKLEQTNTALKNEIIERKKIEKKLNDSLNDKTILLGEIHHRVKNNLQIIISLLKLQKKYIEDPISLEIFQIAISRIQSIAIIHEKLYKSKDIAHTNLPEYIYDLSQYILASHSEGIQPIILTLNVENIFLDITRSIHCGLIINELLINAIKYAFPASRIEEQREKPAIHISFISEKEMYVLVIKDNGVGVRDNKEILQTESLGMKIVNTLTSQLGGILSMINDNGMTFSIRFPINEP
ncbi:MAG: hypothetical protein JXJ04_10950 [Spirochaetales bacterium]|nr:hypothetical protein [Spirochaetales bacterium]